MSMLSKRIRRGGAAFTIRTRSSGPMYLGSISEIMTATAADAETISLLRVILTHGKTRTRGALGAVESLLLRDVMDADSYS
jgi:hypothetical protein